MPPSARCHCADGPVQGWGAVSALLAPVRPKKGAHREVGNLLEQGRNAQSSSDKDRWRLTCGLPGGRQHLLRPLLLKARVFMGPVIGAAPQPLRAGRCMPHGSACDAACSLLATTEPMACGPRWQAPSVTS